MKRLLKHLFSVTICNFLALSFIFISSLCLNEVSAQNKNTITGTIVNLDDDKPIVNRNIRVFAGNGIYYTNTDSKGNFETTIEQQQAFYPLTIDISVELSFREQFDFPNVILQQGESYDLGVIKVELRIFIGDPNYHRSTIIKRKDIERMPKKD